jgi:hypothetical protein
LTTRDGRPSLGSNRQRVAVDNVLTMRWSLDGNELFVMTTDNRLQRFPVERRDGRIRLGDPRELFELPEVRPTPGFGVSADGQEFLFVIDPEAQYQTLSVLMNWPARIAER